MDNYRHKIENSKFVSQTESGILDALNYQAEYASFCCPFYAPLRSSLPLRSLNELEKLPFTTPENIRLQGREMLCVSASKIHRIVSLFSSGTTHEPKRLYFSKSDLQRTVDFFAEGMGWMCEKGDKVGVLLPCTAPDGVGDLLSRGLEALGCHPLRLGLVNKPSDLAKILLEERPAVLVGMPWQLRLLAICLPDLRPKTVLLSADYVPESIYSFLERQWGCRVLAHFGMTETGYGCAVESLAHRGMYLRRDELYAEIIDPESGRALSPGETGELVITTLRREAMPLIRYRTGDLARFSPDASGVIERIYGRAHAHPGNYRLQELLCPLDWLYDYELSRNGESSILLTAFVRENTPEDADSQLAELTAMAFDTHRKNIILSLNKTPSSDAAILRSGKRVGI